MESALLAQTTPESGLSLRLLGPIEVTRDGVVLALPASRKLRALLGYLAVAPRPVGRSRLCELLWDLPNDPRGELRWCLSKLRGLLDTPQRHRVATDGDSVALDLADCLVDAVDAGRAEAGDAEQLRRTLALFGGDFLEGLELDRCPHFDSWLLAQRRHFRDLRTATLQRLLATLPAGTDEALALLDGWLELAPFDTRAHLALLDALAARSQPGACEDHLAAAARLFAAEGLDFAPVRAAWLAARRPARPTPAEARTAAPAPPSSLEHFAAARRAALAVMPFQGGGGARGGLADGLTQDVITRIAKLRSLFVIARGSVFALAEQGLSPQEAGRRLDVDYVASGDVRQDGNRILVTVELVEAKSARIVWADAFEHASGEAFAVLDAIGDRIVASVDNEIEATERNRAILKPPGSLDAWEAYHRGLWHMYRFTQAENAQARQFFETAVRLDPTFGRAHAGLSFTHWQSAFQQWEDRDSHSDLAYAAAGQGLLVDDRDPAVHWAMGRALWLRGSGDAALAELAQAVDLSPNFALGHYALSFVHSQSGDPTAAIGASDQSRRLSPFDPLLFGMLGSRAMAHVRLGQFEEAADWALKAAARPNAHIAILAIAALCLALAGRVDEGRSFAASIRRTQPAYDIDAFLRTFRFDAEGAALFHRAAARIGLG
ncbi:MAG: hypothetical protein RLO51_11560 [Thalassobaculum sp.]|uniref:hypothetical protein n=1 Tax=Thalassobaculum sp. TaxID=2022740 RepID=UPI0032EBF0CD